MDRDRRIAEIAARADFSGVRYAQCWEDADVLLTARFGREANHCFFTALRRMAQIMLTDGNGSV
jgi:hypothetical protein